MSAARRQFVLLAAREWLGTPFAWGQRVKGEGVDCIQLVVAAGLQAGALETDFLKNYAYPSLVEMRRAQVALNVLAPHLDEIEPDQVQPGDIGYYRTIRNFPLHFGIISEKGIIHASQKARKVVETRLPDELRHRVVATFKFKGL